MEYGAHLPILDLGAPPTLRRLTAYARTAAALGLPPPLRQRPPRLQPALAGRPHRPRRGDRRVARHDAGDDVALPVVRGPAPLAKAVGALDVLSGGRVLAGVGPGSSARDYAAAGVPFEERWRRFDEALPALRELLHGDELPAPAGPAPGPADLGGELGLAGRPAARARPRGRVAGVGLQHHPRALPRGGRRAPRDAQRARDGLALRHRGRRAGPSRVLADVLAPLVGRTGRGSSARCSLPIGPAEVCAERMRAFADAGVAAHLPLAAARRGPAARAVHGAGRAPRLSAAADDFRRVGPSHPREPRRGAPWRPTP